MKTVDAIAHILKLEGVEYLSAFPTTPIIESAASLNIRPIICRQERVGVGIADGYSRIKNGRPPGVFIIDGSNGILPLGLPKTSYSIIVGTKFPSGSKVDRGIGDNPADAPAVPSTGALGAKALKKVVATSLSSPPLSPK